MMFEDDAFYALKPGQAPKSTSYLHGFYNQMTEPPAILALIITVCGVCSSIVVPTIMTKYKNGEQGASLFALLAALTVIIGARVVQSLYWAKMDYSRLEYGMRDIIIFSAVIFFTTGSTFIFFGNYINIIIYIYTFLCAIAVWNFHGLATVFIPADSVHYDLPIETRIQYINAIIFALIFLLFAGAAAMLLLGNGANEPWVCAILLPVAPLILFNMAHSHQLSAWPKLIINNKHLAPERIEERLEAIIGVDDAIFRKKRGVISSFKQYREAYRPLLLRRANKRDIPLIRDIYIKNFSYVLERILPETGLTSREVLLVMLNSSWGLGVFGYLRFYIIEVDGTAVGFLMPEFHTEPRIYSLLDRASLAFFFLRRAGPGGLLALLRDLKAVSAYQSRPGLKELCIRYLAISETHAKQGYASRVVRLLRQAYIESSTNGFRAQTIVAHVREGNLASIKLFEKARFTRQPVDANLSDDPLAQAAQCLLVFKLVAS